MHVKCGPGVSEDMPSATWAAANGARAQIGAAGAAAQEYRCREEEWRKWKETKGLGWGGVGESGATLDGKEGVRRESRRKEKSERDEVGGLWETLLQNVGK